MKLNRHLSQFYCLFLGFFLLTLFVPTDGSTSPLGDAADSLAPGQSVKLATPDLRYSLEYQPCTVQMTSYGQSGYWNPIRNEVMFIGKENSATCNNDFLVYNEAANIWSADPSQGGRPVHPDLEVNQSGHGYDLGAVNPLTGDYFFKKWGGSGNIYKWLSANDSWSLETVIPGSSDTSDTLEYFPGLGLVWVDKFGCKIYDLARRTWSTCPGETPSGIGDTYVIAEYQPKANVLIFGGGYLDRYKLYKLDNTGAVSQVADSPMRLGSGWDFGILTADPAGHGYVGFDRVTQDWHHYDPRTDNWSSLTKASGACLTPCDGAPNIVTGGDNRAEQIGIAIPKYGVTMWLNEEESKNNQVWLYKNSPTPPGDHIPPSSPSNLEVR